MRSRTVSLPPACCRAIFSGPPITLASSARRSSSSTSGCQLTLCPPHIVVTLNATKGLGFMQILRLRLGMTSLKRIFLNVLQYELTFILARETAPILAAATLVLRRARALIPSHRWSNNSLPQKQHSSLPDPRKESHPPECR